jgi:hypothetical protein
LPAVSGAFYRLSCSGLLICLTCSSPVWSESERVGFVGTGAELGWGWDSTLEEARPNVCVEFERATEGAQTVNMSISEVSNQSELLEKMDLSATASVKAMVSVEGKASFAKEVAVNSSSSSFLVRATIDNGYEYTAPVPPNPNMERPAEKRSLWDRLFSSRPPAQEPVDGGGRQVRLAPWSLELANKPDNLESFRRVCGDGFVRAIYGGAELYGLVTISSDVVNSSRQFSETIAGSYSFVQADQSFEERIHEIDENAKTNVTFFQVGGSGGAIASDRAGFVEKLQKLTGEAAETPKHMSLAVLPYTELVNWPQAQRLDPESHDLNEILVEYWNFTSLYHDVQRARAHPDKFLLGRGIDEAGLRDLEDELNAIRARLERMARDNATLPEPVTRLPIPTVRLSGAQALVAGQGSEADAQRSSQRASAQTLLRLAADLEGVDTWKPDINWFKVRMPLPRIALAKDDYDDPELRRWIVDWYIGRLARRQCDVSPSARGCLSNAELAVWEQRVILEDVNDLVYGDAAGPGGGDRFDDGHNWRVRESRLRRIVAYPDKFGPETPLFALEFFYDNADGTTFSTGLRGIKGKLKPRVFEFQDDEYLVKAELHLSEKYFDAASFTTNTGRVFDPFKAAGHPVKEKDIAFEHEGYPLLAFFGEVCNEPVGDRALIWPCKLGPVFKNPR